MRSIHALKPAFLPLLILLASACGQASQPAAGSQAAGDAAAASPAELPDNAKTAVFAGGCFWCVEEAFDKVPGVLETTSGYTGGHVEDPSYEQVTRGGTGHLEALRVRFDPDRVSYEQLLDQFWHNIDPTDDRGQFCDKGESYKSAIFATPGEQMAQARASRQALIDSPDAPDPIVTPVLEAQTFYPAEQYHQNYHQKNGLRYTFYKTSCGRVSRLEDVWGEQAAGGPFK